MSIRLFLLTLLVVATTLCGPLCGDEIDFTGQISPILANFCYDCHGPDEARCRADLRLDSQQTWTTAKLDSGKSLIVAGKREQSELWRRISADDDETRMPAADSKKRLTPGQIELVGRWIDSGGRWSPHWAYVPPRKAALPAVKHRAWSTNGIDPWVLKALERRSLVPSDRASREEELRRVALAIVGLPPTLAELEAYLVDKSPDAYERAVERLLASPRFGERFAQDWLDLARYADTHGYHADSQRDMWRWRDWVIDALNHNQPYDQFTIEQLAGDLLPEPTLSQRIATGFHRNTMINHENGAIPEEYRTEYVMDRVATTGTVWLGQTWACARCHDHKYDPLSQRDFYRLFAYFNNVPENGLDGRDGNAVPFISAPTHDQQQQFDTLTSRMELATAALRQREASCEADFVAWQHKQAKAETTRLPPSDTAAWFTLDESTSDELIDRAVPNRTAKVHGQATYVAGKFAEALLFDGDTYAELGDLLAVERDRPLTLSLWMFPTSEEEGTLVARVDDAFTSRGLTLAWEDRRIVARLRNETGANELMINTKEQLPLRRWQHIAFTYDGLSKAAGCQLFIDGKAAPLLTVSDTLTASIATRRPWQLGRRDKKDPWRGMLDELRMYARTLSGGEIELLAGGDPLRDILAKSLKRRTAEETDQLKRYFLQHHDATSQELRSKYAATLQQHDQLLRLIPTTMVMQELATPREAFVLERGLYNRPLERVTPGLPSQILAPHAELPANRLGLAQWLVDRRHPLTGRVAVNRYWSHFFGRGLVATPEDFGVRGTPPTHAELLDWLATEFMESGWNVKHLVRLIVTSSTYRQSSLNGESERRDQENLWLSRGPRVRLSAETIRDSALSASGLLCEKLGGPSVNPYQPTDLWKDLAYDASSYSAQSFKPDRGGNLYRRSLYTFWKRTSPHPFLTAFDAPNRETCAVERPRTSSPLQALVMLNDVMFIEASRALAAQGMKASPTKRGRMEFIFRSLLSRRPTSSEREHLYQLFEGQLKTFQANPQAARELIAVGESIAPSDLTVAELAAWTTVANAVFNLEEFVK